MPCPAPSAIFTTPWPSMFDCPSRKNTFQLPGEGAGLGGGGGLGVGDGRGVGGGLGAGDGAGVGDGRGVGEGLGDECLQRPPKPDESDCPSRCVLK